MKRKTAALILFFILAAPWLSSGRSTNPGKPTVQARISEILVKFPAQSPAEKTNLSAEIIGIGEAGIEEICRRLAAPGKSDDSLARYALEAVSTYVMRPGGERDRSLFTGAIIKALESAPDPDVNAFLISRLQVAGGIEALKPLSRLLTDKKSAEPAIEALTAIRPPGTERALLKALGRKEGANKTALILALGELRSREAVVKIIPFASSGDKNLREASLFALANIGDLRAEAVLSGIPVASSPLERARAASNLILFARRLAEAGKKEPALRICRSVVEKSTGTDESQVRAAALTLLTEILGNKSLVDLLAAMDSPDAAYRQRALDLSLATAKEEATSRWISRAAEVSPEARSQIVEILGRRGDQTALPFVRGELRSDAKAIRTAAIAAAAKLGGDTVMPDLSPIWLNADEEEAQALKGAYLTFPESRAIPEVAKSFEGASLPGKAAIIDFLGERRAKEQAAIVLAGVQSEDENIRKRALVALAGVVREQDLAQIINLLLAASKAAEIMPLQDALAAAAGQSADQAKKADPVIAAIEKAQGPGRINLLRSLAKIGGEKALAAVLGEIQNRDPQIQSAAVYTLAVWPEFQAAEELIKIAGNAASAGNRKHVYLALQGYLRLVVESNLPAAEKLDYLKKAHEIAKEQPEKNIIIDALGSIKDQESLLMLARFLDDPACRIKAVESAVRTALPSPEHDGLSGLETARILKCAAQFMDNEYDRNLAEQYANELLLKEGFVPLFNGKDLTGWKGLVKDPPARSKMTPENVSREQAAADHRMQQHWRVIDGALVFDGKGDSLCTARDYADFELFVDWKIEPQGDSGIYLRGSPQVQIWDPGQWPEGSGGLYNNQNGPSKPVRPADNPVGNWNTFEIRMTGERVTVSLNGALVVDDVVMENYWERDKPIYPTGQIELQAHSTPLYFKNIFIREIPAGKGSQPLSDEEEAAGFVPLFNGSDLTGWTGDTNGYVAEDGKIVIYPDRGSGNLYTEREFSDFIFRFQFKLTPGANNGLGIRAPLEGDAAYVGMEIQILDNGAPEWKDLHPYQYHGSIYGVVPALRGFLKPAGEWNEEEVTARGRRITVRLNGVTIVDADIDEAAKPQTMDGRDHPGLKRDRGHIGFLGHGSRVDFRNIRIKEL